MKHTPRKPAPQSMAQVGPQRVGGAPVGAQILMPAHVHTEGIRHTNLGTPSCLGTQLRGHAGGLKGHGHRHMCARRGCRSAGERGSCTGSTGAAVPEAWAPGWSPPAVSWLRHGSHLWLPVGPMHRRSTWALGQLLRTLLWERTEFRLLCLPCPGAHPERDGSPEGGPGHRCRADGPAFRLPHHRLHLRHRLHPGLVCVPDGESSRARDWVGGAGGGEAVSRERVGAGSLCIWGFQNPGLPTACHGPLPEQHSSPVSSHSWSPGCASRTRVVFTTCLAFLASWRYCRRSDGKHRQH